VRVEGKASSKRNSIGTSNAKNRDLYCVFLTMEMNELGYKIKGPLWNALHSYSNGDLWSKFILSVPQPDCTRDEGLTLCVSIALSLHVSCFISSTNENLITVCCSGYGNMAISDLIYHQDLTVSSSLLKWNPLQLLLYSEILYRHMAVEILHWYTTITDAAVH